MTYLVVKTDASVRHGKILGLGYVIERVRENKEQDEVLLKECECVTVDGDRETQKLIDEAEYLAIIHATRSLLDYVEDGERVEIRCDNDDVVQAVQNQEEIGDLLGTTVHNLLSEVEWTIDGVPRVLNSVADSLSKQASRDKVL